MKKVTLLSLLFLLVATNQLRAQQFTAGEITDWNNIRFSGFVRSSTANTSNGPNKSTSWHWGLNINHPGSGYGGQIAFNASWDDAALPSMYIRSTNTTGMAVWAKVVHSKGNHAIDGKLTAKEIEIKVDTGADFVFAEDYKLPTLYEVEKYIKENKHLLDIPSEKEMIEKGLNVNEMQIKLLQKVEELTLYTIQLNKELQELKKENEEIKNRLK